jgi:hypothetical protein
MHAGWLPREDHARKKGARTRSMGLQIDYLDDHRTDPAEERWQQILAEESRKEEEEFRDYTVMTTIELMSWYRDACTLISCNSGF